MSLCPPGNLASFRQSRENKLDDKLRKWNWSRQGRNCLLTRRKKQARSQLRGPTATHALVLQLQFLLPTHIHCRGRHRGRGKVLQVHQILELHQMRAVSSSSPREEGVLAAHTSFVSHITSHQILAPGTSAPHSAREDA